MTTGRLPRPRGVARPARLLRTLAIGLAAVLALAGCMRIEYTATLHPDDTVSWTMVMATSDEVAKELGMEPQDLWQSVGEDATSDLPEGATVEDYAQDGYTGVKMSAENEPLDAASDAESLTFTREGDEYVVSGTLDLTSSDGELDTADPSTQAMLESFQVRFAVTFPGAVSESNGTVEGTTVTWEPKYGESTPLSARGSAVADGTAAAPSASASESESASAEPSSEPAESPTDEAGAPTDTTAATPQTRSSGPSPLLLVGLGVLVLAAVATVVVLVVRQRGAAQRAALAGGVPTDLPPWQGGAQPGYGQPYPPAPEGFGQPGYPPAPGAYGQPYPPAEPGADPYAPPGAVPPPPAPVDAPPAADRPTGPLTPPPPPPAAPAPPADEPGSTPPPPPPA